MHIRIKMKSYCLECRKNTENINPRVSKQVMVKQCYYQNVQYVMVKTQEAKGLLSNLGFRKPLSKVPMLGDILF